MMSPETAISPGGAENAELAVRNLRNQVCQLESTLLEREALLQQCRQSQAIFEDAAAERLQVIQQGDELLRARADAILALQREAVQLRLQLNDLYTASKVLAHPLPDGHGSVTEPRGRPQSVTTLSIAQELASPATIVAEERQRLQRACREAGRGMEELASRERALTREILELRNEGLLHSLVRRVSSLLS